MELLVKASSELIQLPSPYTVYYQDREEKGVYSSRCKSQGRRETLGVTWLLQLYFFTRSSRCNGPFRPSRCTCRFVYPRRPAASFSQSREAVCG